MPPKKRERDRSTTTTECNGEVKKEEKVEEVSLNPIKSKPQLERFSQLYRLVRQRFICKPLFLYRNLTYMQSKMSRNHAKRKTFKVDSMLYKKKEIIPENPKKYMTITYLGYYDDSLPSDQQQTVRVETHLHKTSSSRRKETCVPVVKLRMGTNEVPVNPRDDDDRLVPIISIPPETISANNSLVKSRHLVIMVVGDKQEPLECSYELYNSKGQCLMPAGFYEGIFKAQSGLWVKLTPTTRSLIRDTRVPSPKISFKFEWTVDAKSGWVERPRSLSTIPELIAPTSECPGENKENRPAKRGPCPPSRASRSSRSGSTPSALVTVDGEGSNASAAASLTDNAVTMSFNFHSDSRTLDTPAKSTTNCPFCDLNCNHMYSLFKHLKVCHDRFSFTFTMTDNHVRVDVTVNEQADNSYEGNPYDAVLVGEQKRLSVSRRTVWTKVLVCHPRRGRPSLSEFFDPDDVVDMEVQRPMITGHDRLYFHTTTCLPIHPRDLDVDSEAERDPKWLRQKTVMMIDEFTDVNEGEKAIMKLWNLHVLKYGFVGDCQIPLACSMFVKEKGKEILRSNLYRNFILHLCNLFDFGLLNPVQVYKLICQVQDILRHDSEAQRVIKDSIIEERRSWHASGGSNGPRNKKLPEGASCDTQPSTSNNTKMGASSTFIAGDGTLRRKMTQQTPQSAKKNCSSKTMEKDEDEKPSEPVGPEKLNNEAPAEHGKSAERAGSSERALRKRKLSLQDRPGDEPAKRVRCGSDPLESGKTNKAAARPSSDDGKPQRSKSDDKSTRSASDEGKPLRSKSDDKTTRSASDESKAMGSKSEDKPLRRKSTPPSEEVKAGQPLRRKSSPPSEDGKPPMRKSTAP